MKKIILIICLNILLPLLLLVILPSFTIRKRQGTSINSGTQLLSFVKDKPVTFSFISDNSNLQSLSIDIKNPGVINNSQINFDITGPNSQRSIVFYGANVGDPSTVPLKFSPFSDPKSTKYIVSLTTNNTDHGSLYLITNDIYQPHFNSFYLRSDIRTNLKVNFQRQLDLFKQRSLIHSIIYFTTILLLDYLIILK